MAIQKNVEVFTGLLRLPNADSQWRVKKFKRGGAETRSFFLRYSETSRVSILLEVFLISLKF